MGYSIVSTVTAAASNHNLATLDDVKAELDITGSAKDTLLNRYIASASAAIEQYCNRVFVVETIKDEVFPDREYYAFQVSGQIQTVRLSRYPVATLSSVTENGETLSLTTDCKIDAPDGLLLRLNEIGYPRPWLAWPIVATYSAGFATIPSDVADAAIRLVKARYLARGRDPYLKSESIPGVRDVTYWVATGSDAGNMPPDIADILDNYRVPVVA